MNQKLKLVEKECQKDNVALLFKSKMDTSLRIKISQYAYHTPEHIKLCMSVVCSQVVIGSCALDVTAKAKSSHINVSYTFAGFLG